MTTEETIMYEIEWFSEDGPKRAKVANYSTARGYYYEKKEIYNRVNMYELRTTKTIKLIDAD